MEKKKWIQGAIKHEGALRKTAKQQHLIKGDEKLSMTDLKKLEKEGGKTAKRAHLAETLRKFYGGGQILDWAEGNAEKLVQKYLDVEPNEVFSQKELRNKGDYYIGSENTGDGEMVYIEVCFGDEFEKNINEVESNYEHFTKFAEDISDNMNYEVEVLTDNDNNTIMFQFTEWYAEDSEEPEEDYAKGGIVTALYDEKDKDKGYILERDKENENEKEYWTGSSWNWYKGNAEKYKTKKLAEEILKTIKYLTLKRNDMFTSFDDGLTKKEVLEFINLTKNINKKYWIRESTGYSKYLYKGQLRNNDSPAGIFQASKIGVDRLNDSYKFKIQIDELYPMELADIPNLDANQNLKEKPVSIANKEWKKYVKDISSFSVDEETDNTIVLVTRENGSVGDEEHSPKDVQRAKDIFKQIKNKYPDTKGRIYTVDEWVYLELEAPTEMAAGGKVKEKVFIEYLNKDKGYKMDRKYFNSYEQAERWARTNFDKFDTDYIRYEYAEGGEIDWGADLGDGFSIGNDVFITDSKSMYNGKTGFVSGLVGKDLLVTISENGNDRSVVVSKKGVEMLDAPEYAKGGKIYKMYRMDEMEIPEKEESQEYYASMQYGEGGIMSFDEFSRKLPDVKNIFWGDQDVVYKAKYNPYSDRFAYFKNGRRNSEKASIKAAYDTYVLDSSKMADGGEIDKTFVTKYRDFGWAIEKDSNGVQKYWSGSDWIDSIVYAELYETKEIAEEKLFIITSDVQELIGLTGFIEIYDYSVYKGIIKEITIRGKQNFHLKVTNGLDYTYATIVDENGVERNGALIGVKLDDSSKMADGGEVNKKFFRDRTGKIKDYFNMNEGFEGLAKATGNESLTKFKHADGGMMAEGGETYKNFGKHIIRDYLFTKDGTKVFVKDGYYMYPSSDGVAVEGIYYSVKYPNSEEKNVSADELIFPINAPQNYGGFGSTMAKGGMAEGGEVINKIITINSKNFKNEERKRTVETLNEFFNENDLHPKVKIDYDNQIRIWPESNNDIDLIKSMVEDMKYEESEFKVHEPLNYDIEWVDEDGEEYNEGYWNWEDALEQIKWIKENHGRVTDRAVYLQDANGNGTRVGKFEDGGVMAKGGSIPNNYEGKTAEEVWDSWTIDQKNHFLSDHKSVIEYFIEIDPKVKIGTSISSVWSKHSELSKKYNRLTKYTKDALIEHIFDGQYANGGMMAKGGMTFKREKFKSTPIQEGEVFFDTPNMRSGYYNQRVIKKIDGKNTLIAVADVFNGRVEVKSSPYEVPTAYVQKVVDENKKQQFEKYQDEKQAIFNLSKEIGANKAKGGNLKTPKVIAELYAILKKLASVEKNVADSSVGAAPNSMSFRASQSGTAISIETNNIYRGGYYSVDKPFLLMVKVGGALPYEQSKVIRGVLIELLSKYYYTTNIGTSRIYDTSGTNWSAVMIVAPSNMTQWSPLKELDIFSTIRSMAKGGMMAKGGATQSYSNMYISKDYIDDVMVEIKKALPNHKFEKGDNNNTIIVDDGRFVIQVKGRFSEIGEYGYQDNSKWTGETYSGTSVETLRDAVDFIKYSKMAHGGMMAKGGEAKGGELPEHEEWAKFVKDNRGYFQIEEETEDTIHLNTREHGSIGDEEYGIEDVQFAKEIYKKIKEKYPKTKARLYDIDEWIELELTFVPDDSKKPKRVNKKKYYKDFKKYVYENLKGKDVYGWKFNYRGLEDLMYFEKDGVQVRATPFWDNQEIIPIDVLSNDGDDLIYQDVIEFKPAFDLEKDFKNYKSKVDNFIWYGHRDGYFAKGGYMAKGGEVTFDDKVKAISKKLEGKSVPAQYRKEYGSKYDKEEADEAARRIVGNMRKLYGE